MTSPRSSAATRAVRRRWTAAWVRRFAPGISAHLRKNVGGVEGRHAEECMTGSYGPVRANESELEAGGGLGGPGGPCSLSTASAQVSNPPQSSEDSEH